jgi:hypothetical protein
VEAKLGCDLSIAELKDPCDAKMEGASACSVDRKQIVTCKGGEFVADEVCKRPKVCLPEGGPRCAQP